MEAYMVASQAGLPRGNTLEAHLTMDYLNPTFEFTMFEKGRLTSIQDVLKTCPKNDVYVRSFVIPNTPKDIAFATTCIPPFKGHMSKKKMNAYRDFIIKKMEAGYQSYQLK